ncbi:nucleoside transporter-domain-containing protein [Scheffersomyces amazonensis]|uniref:nucleoside transporter-domain-containing protein n=1 Tax=Scheffersomyces amazonensis TaxID=1078765 RepID=UPI00315CBE50
MTTHRSTESSESIREGDNDYDHQQSQDYDPIVLRLLNSNSFIIKLSQLRYITFTIVGIALLWPWNCFLSASAYYGERFSHSPSLIKVYSSTMMSVSTITSILYSYYLSQAQAGVNYKFRLSLGLWLTIFVFLFMSITCISDLLIMMNDNAFFTILMIMVFISALATCLAQNGTMAIVNVLGGIYANAVMVGQAVAGVLPALALIISILLVGDKKTNSTDENYHVEKNYGVFVYYITASLISIVSLLMIFWINHHKVESTYRSLNQLIEEQPLNSSEIIDEPDIKQKTHVPFSVLWSKLKLIVSTIFITFSVTLIFPVFASTVESVNTESKFWFYKKEIFIPFIYLIWNLGDLLGRIFCGYPKLHMLITNPKTLIIYSIARLIFIPLFLTCNIHPYSAANQSSALINSDSWYIILQLLFGISNGQLCTSCFMIVANFCDTDEEKEAAGGFTAVFLSVGLAAGSIFSYLLVFIID